MSTPTSPQQQAEGGGREEGGEEEEDEGVTQHESIPVSKVSQQKSSSSSSSSSPLPPRAAPAFAVCILNDSLTLRCMLSAGASTISSECAELTRPTTAVPPATAASSQERNDNSNSCSSSQRPPPTTTTSSYASSSAAAAAAAAAATAPSSSSSSSSSSSLRCIVYSPNLVADDFPHFAWDADLIVDGTAFFVGPIAKRCDVIVRTFPFAAPPRRVQLRLHRLRLVSVRSPESAYLCQQLLHYFNDTEANPRGGSLPLSVVSEYLSSTFPHEWQKVVGGEHYGSLGSFLSAHEEYFVRFRYSKEEIQSRNLTNISAGDERIAIRKEVRDTCPPLLRTREDKIVEILKRALSERDSHVHRLVRLGRDEPTLRIGCSPGFSALMHLLQKYRHIFRWSTDPQQLCIVGLVDPQSVVANHASGDVSAIQRAPKKQNKHCNPTPSTVTSDQPQTSQIQQQQRQQQQHQRQNPPAHSCSVRVGDQFVASHEAMQPMLPPPAFLLLQPTYQQHEQQQQQQQLQQQQQQAVARSSNGVGGLVGYEHGGDEEEDFLVEGEGEEESDDSEVRF